MQALLSPGLPGASTNTDAQEDQEQLLVRIIETNVYWVSTSTPSVKTEFESFGL